MALSAIECAKQLRKVYSSLKPYAYITIKGSYIFNLLSGDPDDPETVSEFCVVDPENGSYSECIPPVELLSSPVFQREWKNAQVISESRPVKHFFVSGDELYHYGITGMKWGVRRFQYDDGRYTPEGKERYFGSSSKKAVGENTEGYISETAASSIGTALTSIAFIGAYIGLQKLVSNLSLKAFQVNETDRSRSLSEDLLSDISEHKKFDADNPPKAIKGNHSPEEDMAAVNPKWDSENPVRGTTVNCVLCSMTYDLRRRGYDVTAKLSSYGNATSLLMKDIYENPKIDNFGKKNFTEVFNEASKKYPEGSRGMIMVHGDYGIGHNMAFEVRNGKFTILDAQRNEEIKPAKLREWGFNPLKTTIVRTDHLNLKMENLDRVCNELKSDWKKTIKKSKEAEKDKNKEKAGSKAENKESGRDLMTTAEKEKSLEEQWKKQHSGVRMTSEARTNMDNWIRGHMWAYPSGGSYLIHYGIPGQKPGRRRYQNPDGSLTPEGRIHYGVGEERGSAQAGYYDKKNGQKDIKRLNKDAEKDAKEYARAKAYYGNGAGTRRKQIKNLISERMKDSDYKKAFEKYLSEQDMSKHQKAANRERHVQDAKETTAKTVRGVKNFLLGNAVPMTTAAIAIGAALKYTGAGAKIAQYSKRTFASAMRWIKSRGTASPAASSAVNNAKSAFDAFMRRG